MGVFRRHEADIVIRTDNPPMRISSYKYVQTNSFDHMAKTNNSQSYEVDKILTNYNLSL